jgi:hypothetical protein
MEKSCQKKMREYYLTALQQVSGKSAAAVPFREAARLLPLFLSNALWNNRIDGFSRREHVHGLFICSVIPSNMLPHKRIREKGVSI